DCRIAAMIGYPITTSSTSIVGVSSIAAKRPEPSVLDFGGFFLPTGAALVGASVTAMEPSSGEGAVGPQAHRPVDVVPSYLVRSCSLVCSCERAASVVIDPVRAP